MGMPDVDDVAKRAAVAGVSERASVELDEPAAELVKVFDSFPEFTAMLGESAA
ncbi:MAG TPA: hypothetical protein QF520_11100 [SAR202 cluster bacterium]|nr:hypothetical protein [SAR202 cluster bacterium]HJO82935.1 hypothetical protein [SAR202 cluster bacterium]